MTASARDWHGDRRAVFDRDDHTCRRCGATDAGADGAGADADDTDTDTDTDTDPSDLRLYPVGDVPLEGRVHESSLVTVCERCFAGLRNDPAPADPVRLADDELFALAREMTQRQGVTVSAVASFASLSTSLPADLEAAGDDADAKADAEAEYVQARREVLLAIDSVPARLERLAAVDGAAFDPAVADALESIVDAGRRLQSELREIVALCEAVAAGLDRCHGCLDPHGPDERAGAAAPAADCPTCRLERRDVSDWREGSGSDAEADTDAASVSFGHLFTAINDTLQNASETTEELTGCAATLAEELQGDAGRA